MADDNYGDKTEPATPKKREEARDEGQVAKSQDLTSATLLLVALIALWLMARTFVSTMANLLQALLGGHAWDQPERILDSSLRVAVPHAFRIVGPMLATVAFVAIVVTAFQVGLHISGKPLMPKVSKINPLKGFKRLFEMRNLMRTVMNIGKIILIGVIVYIEIRKQLPVIVSLGGIAFPENFAIAAGIIFGLALRIAIAMFILGVADWIWQKWKHERDLRMSKQEVKEEAKRMEGDQTIRWRRRQMARKMIMQRMHRDVPTADVVVTNPTELAIAIRYDPETMSSPKVVAKGSGFLAARIRQIAIANGVPILEKKSLAQALYKTVEVGQEVPPELYQAIAEILSYVYELAGKGLRRRRAG